MNRFGEKLKALRLTRGLTMRQLGELLEVSDSYVSKMETGDKIPNVAMVLRVSQVFDVTTDVLIKDELNLDS